MPFTISHVAAVLPFTRILRQQKLLSAAVIGAMVPDFGLFLPEDMPRYETHGLPALVTFCLPAGLICYWVFQLHIKPATLELLPGRLYDLWREDGRPARWLSIRQWMLATVGVLIGAFTHLVWDGFTHENAAGVRMLSSLDDVRIRLLGTEFSWYRFLQHTSSVIGLALVVWFLWMGISSAANHAETGPRRLDRRARRGWFLAYVVIAIMSSGLVFAHFLGRVPYAVAFHQRLAMLAIASLWGIALSLLVVSAFLRWRLHQRSP